MPTLLRQPSLSASTPSPPRRYEAAWWSALLVIPTTILGAIMLGTGVFGADASAGGAVACITVLVYVFCGAWAGGAAG